MEKKNSEINYVQYRASNGPHHDRQSVNTCYGKPDVSPEFQQCRKPIVLLRIFKIRSSDCGGRGYDRVAAQLQNQPPREQLCLRDQTRMAAPDSRGRSRMPCAYGLSGSVVMRSTFVMFLIVFEECSSGCGTTIAHSLPFGHVARMRRPTLELVRKRQPCRDSPPLGLD